MTNAALDISSTTSNTTETAAPATPPVTTISVEGDIQSLASQLTKLSGENTHLKGALQAAEAALASLRNTVFDQGAALTAQRVIFETKLREKDEVVRTAEERADRAAAARRTAEEFRAEDRERLDAARDEISKLQSKYETNLSRAYRTVLKGAAELLNLSIWVVGGAIVVAITAGLATRILTWMIGTPSGEAKKALADAGAPVDQAVAPPEFNDVAVVLG